MVFLLLCVAVALAASIVGSVALHLGTPALTRR
jgi:hypothetical protein